MYLLITLISLLVAAGSIVYAFVSNRLARRDADAQMAEADRNFNLLEEKLKNMMAGMENDLENKIKISAFESLQSTSSQLRAANIEQIESVLQPLRTKIDDFHSSLSQANMNAIASQRSLNDSVERLMQLNMTISRETRSLTAALKGNSKAQGEWGETVLVRLLEDAGLVKGINFECQMTKDDSWMTIKNSSGAMLRPDVVVYLPEGNKLIIDSKVPLKAYLEYCEATDKEMERAAISRHVAAVKSTISQLASKEYHNYMKGAADYVVMFIPNEGAYLAALRFDPSVAEFASNKRVILASSAHLMSIVQLTAQMWRNYNQKKNTEDIAKLGGLLYDRVVAFTKDMTDIEVNLARASKAYANAFAKLTTGAQSVVARAERLRELGVKATNKIPSAFTENSDENPTTDQTVSESSSEPFQYTILDE